MRLLLNIWLLALVAPSWAVAQSVSILEPEAPTSDRPYFYMRFDGETLVSNPGTSPVGIPPLHSDKIVILNFINEDHRFSDLQTDVIERTLLALIDETLARDVLLVDVVVGGHNQRPVYAAAFEVFYEENTLLTSGYLDNRVLPYATILANQAGSIQAPLVQQMDFALMLGVTDNDAYRRSRAAIFNGINHVFDRFSDPRPSSNP